MAAVRCSTKVTPAESPVKKTWFVSSRYLPEDFDTHSKAEAKSLSCVRKSTAGYRG